MFGGAGGEGTCVRDWSCDMCTAVPVEVPISASGSFHPPGPASATGRGREPAKTREPVGVGERATKLPTLADYVVT